MSGDREPRMKIGMPDRAGVEALFVSGVVAALAPPGGDLEDLFADERRHIAGAIAKRQHEFATARRCARRALVELGVAPQSLVPNPDRSPRWPPGVVGSIAHTAGLCAVVAAREERAVALGIDVESDAPLQPALERRICTPGERAWLATADLSRRGHLVKLMFVAKEAVYKCQYPVTGRTLGFQDVELGIDLAVGRCRVTLTPSTPPEVCDVLESTSCRYLVASGYVVCGASLRPSPHL